jgi:hypothetical protein
MKTLHEYIFEAQINEGLLSGIAKFFSKIYKNQKKFGDKGKIIKAEIKQMKRCKSPIDFANLETDEYKALISDKKSGFPILNEYVKNSKKYVGDDTGSVKTYLYFQDLKDGAIQCGALMFTEKPEVREDEAIQLICLDAAKIVSNDSEIFKFMVDNWMEDFKGKKEIKYIDAKPTHPKIKGIMAKVGFSQDKGNKEIYIKQNK